MNEINIFVIIVNFYVYYDINFVCKNGKSVSITIAEPPKFSILLRGIVYLSFSFVPCVMAYK